MSPPLFCNSSQLHELWKEYEGLSGREGEWVREIGTVVCGLSVACDFSKVPRLVSDPCIRSIDGWVLLHLCRTRWRHLPYLLLYAESNFTIIYSIILYGRASMTRVSDETMFWSHFSAYIFVIKIYASSQQYCICGTKVYYKTSKHL